MSSNRGAVGQVPASHHTQPQAAAGAVALLLVLLLLPLVAAGVVAMVAGRVSIGGHRRSTTSWHRCVCIGTW